jgi:predicted component of type VI protein secretion system
MAMITVMLGEQTMSTHTISHHPFVAGREASCDVAIENIGVSRQHCRFVLEGDRFKVEDMGSANGTLLNGEKISGAAEIKDGDEVKIGKYRLLFHRAEGEPPPPAKAEAGSLADIIEGKAPDEDKPAPADDMMKTFQMKAEDIREKVGAGVGAPGQRASDVAGALGGEKASKGISRPTFYMIMGAMAVVLIGLLAVVLVLVLKA